MKDNRMTLKEFVNDVSKEMEENGWEDLPLEFCTSDRSQMHYLSIYDVDNKDNTKSIVLDIGDAGE